MTDHPAPITESAARAVLADSGLHPDTADWEAEPVDGGWYFSQPRKGDGTLLFGSPNFVVAHNGRVAALFFLDTVADVMARLNAQDSG